MRLQGLILIAVLLAIPVPWFFAIALKQDPIAAFSQFLGAEALILMAVTQLLATRLRWLEAIFGGLDRIYVLHKHLAITAVAAVMLHDTIDADMDELERATTLNEIGEISLYGILILVALTVATFIPYHLWRWTHQFIGIFFTLAAIHYALILKPFSLSDPLGAYIMAFCILGFAAYLYSLIFHAKLRGAKPYIVEAIDRTGGAVAITLKPIGLGLRAAPGQFAFVRFQARDLGEVHPFTLSNAPDADGALRITVKALGDYTARLASVLRPGMTARVSGPFGRFRRPKRARSEIWIASGIGVTPFAAWTAAMSAPDRPVDMFYSVRSLDDAALLPSLEAADAAFPNFRLHVIASERDGRLTAARIAETVAAPLRDAEIFFCGPVSMRRQLAHDFRAAGVPAKRFHFEEFEIRTGIGLTALAHWVMGRLRR